MVTHILGVGTPSVDDGIVIQTCDPRIEARPRLWARPGLWAAIVLVFFGLPLFIGLGRTDYENDEALYSVIVDTMVKDGDYLTPKHPFQSPFLEKPPLKFWMVAAPISLGLLPNDEFGMRFWDPLLATGAFLYVFAIGRRLAGPVCGLGALLILFAHQPLLFEHGLRSNNMEAALLLAYCAGVYHFLAWKTGASATRKRHLFALGLFFALGFMVKFVAMLFLPLVLGAAILLSPDARTRLRSDWRGWLGAGVLAVVLAAPWYLYQIHHSGENMWTVIFGQQVVTRFTAYLDPNHLRPWHYYWSSIFHELRLSGAIVTPVLGVLVLLVTAARQRRGDAASILVWFALPLALMSLMTSKLYHYAYPYLPPIALAGGVAAVTIAGFVWSLGSRWSRRLDAVLERGVAPILRFQLVRPWFIGLAVAAIAVAIATQASGGHLRIHVDVVVLRNASALRPWLLAILMLTLAGRLGSGLRVGLAGLVLVLVLPVFGYTRSLARLPVQDHPVRSIAQCLQAVGSRSQPGDLTKGMWVEGDPMSHVYYTYFRTLGPWQQRLDNFSDPTVYMDLYVSAMRMPVLLSTARYEQFIHATRTGEADVLARVARKTGLDVATVKADADLTDVTLARFPHAVLMLPGPFSVCGVDHIPHLR